MSAESSATTRWGLIGAVVALVLIVIFSSATLISALSSPDSARGQEVAEDSGLTRDQRTTVRDQIGRTVYSPLNEGGDVFEPTTGADENSSSYFTFRPDVEWQRLSGLTKKSVARDYPYSAVAGPWEVTDGIAHSFARSPQGAALAGIHMLNGLAQGGERAAKATIRFVDDDLSVEIAEQMLAEPEGPQLPEQSWSSAYASYTILDYSDDEATIRYGLADGDGYASWDLTVHWVGEDWKMRANSVAPELRPQGKEMVTRWVSL